MKDPRHVMPLLGNLAGSNNAAGDRGVAAEKGVAAIIEGARAKGEATGVATVRRA